MNKSGFRPLNSRNIIRDSRSPMCRFSMVSLKTRPIFYSTDIFPFSLFPFPEIRVLIFHVE